MPAKYEPAKILDFYRYLIYGGKLNFKLYPTGTINEVPLTFNAPLNWTMGNKGSRLVTIKNIGCEKDHYTVDFFFLCT